MEFLKLMALDADDLAVISTHLQDAEINMEDMLYIPEKHRFVFAALRAAPDQELHREQRCYSGVHFDHVLAVRHLHIDRTQKSEKLVFIGTLFEPTDVPGGKITLFFKGEKSIQLDVECIEAQFRDFPMRETYQS